MRIEFSFQIPDNRRLRAEAPAIEGGGEVSVIRWRTPLAGKAQNPSEPSLPQRTKNDPPDSLEFFSERQDTEGYLSSASL